MEQDEPEKNSNTYEPTPNIEPYSEDSFLQSSYARSNTGSDVARPDFREQLFYIWYNHDRPGLAGTKELIAKFLSEEIVPADWTLRNWIADFNDRAYNLDRRVHEQIEAIVISEKVEMMKRHATIGFNMQGTALEWIKNFSSSMKAGEAIRMLVEGIRIERESKGIPEALEKMSKMTDEEVLAEIKQLITSTSVSLEEVNANS